MWEKLLLEVVNSHMPSRQKRVKNKPSPWMTSDIIKIIKERDKLKAKAHKAKSNIANEKDGTIKKTAPYAICIENHGMNSVSNQEG